MKALSAVCVMALLLAVSSTERIVQAAETPEGLDLRREVLKVYSAFEWDPAQIADPPSFYRNMGVTPVDETWILAETKPKSRHGRLEGYMIDPITKKATQLPGQKVVSVMDGKLDLLAVLKGAPQQTSWDYRREQPALIGADGMMGVLLSSRDSLFSSDTVLIYRLDKSQGTGKTTIDFNESELGRPFGVHREANTYMVPTEWQAYFVPALKYYQENAELFQPRHAQKNQEQLWKLLSDENPFISIAACRALARGSALAGGRVLDATGIAQVLKSAQGLRQAVFTMVLWRSIPLQIAEAEAFSAYKRGEVGAEQMEKALPPVIRAVRQLTATATNSADLEGLALGVCAAQGAPASDFEMTHSTQPYLYMDMLGRLLLPLRAKLAAWGTLNATDQRLNFWLTKAGVPEVMPAQDKVP